jgi:hypothetical protein
MRISTTRTPKAASGASWGLAPASDEHEPAASPSPAGPPGPRPGDDRSGLRAGIRGSWARSRGSQTRHDISWHDSSVSLSLPSDSQSIRVDTAGQSFNRRVNCSQFGPRPRSSRDEHPVNGSTSAESSFSARYSGWPSLVMDAAVRPGDCRLWISHVRAVRPGRSMSSQNRNPMASGRALMARVPA